MGTKMRVLIITLASIFTSHVAMAMISDEEIRKHNSNAKHSVVVAKKTGKQHLHEYSSSSLNSLRHKQQKLTANELFVEILNNNVVRLLSRKLRKSAASSKKTISLRFDRKNYSIIYSAKIEKELITYEVCAMKFKGIPTIKNINGIITGSRSFTERQIRRMLYVLQQDGIIFKEIVFKLNNKEADKFENLYKELQDQDYPLIKVISKGGTQIFIKLAIEKSKK
jgi:hypothetical protein